MEELVSGNNIYFRDGQIWRPAVITNIMTYTHDPIFIFKLLMDN